MFSWEIFFKSESILSVNSKWQDGVELKETREAGKKEALEGTGTDDSEEEEDNDVVKSKWKQGTKQCKKNKKG